MELQEILQNEELNARLNRYIEHTYNKYKLHNALSLEDFYQETYLYMIPRLRKFDSEKSTLETFIPLIVMTSGKQALRKTVGNSKYYNKVDIEHQSIRFDKPLQDTDGTISFGDVLPSNINVENEVITNTQISEILNMSNLSEKQKTVLKLLLQDYSFDEISKMLDKTFTGVWLCFDRARKKILMKYNVV